MELNNLQLKEWERLEVLNYDDTTLQELLGLQQRNIINTSLSDKGLLIRANSHVGFEMNQAFSLEINPKISYISVIKMIGFLHGFIPTVEESLAHLGSGERSFRDLLILQWLDLVEKLSIKIRKKYVSIQSRERYIKGKINLKELAKQGAILDHTPIEYQVLQLNQPLNQVIKAGLLFFKKESTNPFLVNKINLLLRNYISVSVISLNKQLLESLIFRLTRLEEGYLNTLDYLNWLLTVIGIGQGNQIGKSLWLNMNALFQNYLTKAFKIYLPEYHFLSEVSNQTIFNYERDSNPFNKAPVSIRPDLLVYDENKLTTIIDFKYKNFVQDNVSTSDLYQLSNYGLSIGEGKINPIILYPTIQDVPDQKIRVNISVSRDKQKIILRSANLIKLEELIETGNYFEVSQFFHKLLKECI